MAKRAGTALVLTIVAVTGALVACDQLTDPDPAPATTVPVSPATPVVAVKVDNVPAARPQSGLGAADVVHVQPVEGGLTRLVAVHAGDLPAEVGPVRGARRTGLELLAQYGEPVLAFSGAAPELLPASPSPGPRRTRGGGSR